MREREREQTGILTKKLSFDYERYADLPVARSSAAIPSFLFSWSIGVNAAWGLLQGRNGVLLQTATVDGIGLPRLGAAERPVAAGTQASPSGASLKSFLGFFAGLKSIRPIRPGQRA